MNRNENEAESFAGNFMAFGEEALFFEVPLAVELTVALTSSGAALSSICCSNLACRGLSKVVIPYPVIVRQRHELSKTG